MADTIRILGQTAGDDYATVAAMEAAIPANIVTHGGDNWVVRVRADSNYVGFSFPQVTTDATHQLIFEAFPGSEVDGAGVGAGFESATGGFSGFMGSVITFANTTHIQYVGLKIIALGTSQSAIWLQECSNKIFKDCFVKSDLFVGIEVANGGACEIEFINTIIADCGSVGTSYGNTSASADIRYDRCTVVNSAGHGFDDRGFGAAGALYGRNLFSFGNSGLDFAFRIDQSDYDFLASEDTSATAETNTTGFNGRTTADFVNYAGGNYSLAVGSSLRTAGVGGGPIGAILPVAAAPAALVSPSPIQNVSNQFSPVAASRLNGVLQ